MKYIDEIFLQFMRYLMRPSEIFAKKIEEAVKKVPFDEGWQVFFVSLKIIFKLFVYGCLTSSQSCLASSQSCLTSSQSFLHLWK